MNKKSYLEKVSFSDRKYLTVVSLFLFFLFCLLIIQFYRIQILQGDKWSKEAQLQHHHFVIEPFQRGRFFANTSLMPNHPKVKQPFVFDVLKYHLYVDSDSIPIHLKEEVKNNIFALFHLTNDKREKIHTDIYRKSRSRRLVSWVTQVKKEEIEKWWFPFARKNKIAKNAIYFLKDFKRSYPYKSLLGQVLSTVQEEKESFSQAAIPIGGLEQFFHSILTGKVGKRLFLRSPLRSLDSGKVLERPQNGADIFLTISHYLQAVAESELKKGIDKMHAKGGWAIVMDPFTGEIFALAQYPFFDPAKYSEYYNDPEKEEDTKPRAVCDAFEPGSIFKPITLAICFLANEELIKKGQRPLFDPEEKIATSNGHFPGRARPLKDGRCHSFLNMNLAVQKSSNIYMAKLIQRVIDRLGENWYREKLVEFFGFGKKTGIELPAETAGLVPTPGKLHPNGRLEWSQDTPYTLAIGHNILVNSIQMMKAFAIFANGGYEIKPTLIKKVIKQTQTGEEETLFDLQTYLSHKKNRKILDENVTKRLIEGMKFVTKLGGTAMLGDIMGYSDAGKSGTSEKIVDGKYSKKKYLSSFIGIAPANNPRFVILVMVDEPEVKFIPGIGKTYHGGVCAAPIFKEIALRSLQYLGIAPDDPFGYPYGDPRRNVHKSDWAKEVKQLKELYTKWNEKHRR